MGPSGKRCAVVAAGGLLPYFGELKWEPAPMFVLSLAELEAAEEKGVRP